MTRQRMFSIFAAIALGGTWLMVLVFELASPEGLTPELARVATMAAGIPVLLASLIVQGPILQQKVLGPLGLAFKPERWWLGAWALPVVTLAGGLLVLALLGETVLLDAADQVAHQRAQLEGEALAAFEESLAEGAIPGTFYRLMSGLFAGLFVNLLFSLASEIGFRGFLFREIQGGFWRRALLIGLFETAWFAPLAFLGASSVPGVVGLLLASAHIVLLSPALVYLRVRAGSVIPVAIARSSLIALTRVATEIAPDAAPSAHPLFGWPGLVGIALAVGLCLAHDRFIAKQTLVAAPAPTPA